MSHTPDAHPPETGAVPPQRAPWTPPRLDRLNARHAAIGPNDQGGDGQFSQS